MRKALFLITLLAFVLIACSEDSGTNTTEDSYYFEFKEGNEWYYSTYRVDLESNETDTTNFETLVFEETEKKGKKAYKFIEKNVEDEINPDRFLFGRTERDGFYIYYDELREDVGYPSEIFSDVWIKNVSFTENNWQTIDYTLDSIIEKTGARVQIEFNLSGKRIGEIEVEYKGKIYEALKVQNILIDQATYTLDNEIIYRTDNNRIIEYTIIKGIGIYKFERIVNDEPLEIFSILKDHKTN